MVTARKLTANRFNAAKSTGPRTPGGKAAAKFNAVAHGLRSPSPVLPGEEPAEWERFLAAVIDHLVPVGPVEAEVVARIASLQWRLRRAMLCEVAAAAHPPAADPDAPPRFGSIDPADLQNLRRALADTERELARGRRLRTRLAGLSVAADGDRMSGDDALALLDAADLAVPPRPDVWVAPPPTGEAETPDEEDRPGVFIRPPPVNTLIGDPPPGLNDGEFRAAVGLPDEWLDRAGEWDGWTAGAVRRGVGRLAAWAGWTVDRLLAEMGDIDVFALERAAVDMRAKIEPLAAADLGRRAVPPEAALAAVLRYEPHLSRELGRAMDMLERARALRPVGRGRRRRAG